MHRAGGVKNWNIDSKWVLWMDLSLKLQTHQNSSLIISSRPTTFQLLLSPSPQFMHYLQKCHPFQFIVTFLPSDFNLKCRHLYPLLDRSQLLLGTWEYWPSILSRKFPYLGDLNFQPCDNNSFWLMLNLGG